MGDARRMPICLPGGARTLTRDVATLGDRIEPGRSERAAARQRRMVSHMRATGRGLRRPRAVRRARRREPARRGATSAALVEVDQAQRQSVARRPAHVAGLVVTCLMVVEGGAFIADVVAGAGEQAVGLVAGHRGEPCCARLGTDQQRSGAGSCCGQPRRRAPGLPAQPVRWTAPPALADRVGDPQWHLTGLVEPTPTAGGAHPLVRHARVVEGAKARRPLSRPIKRRAWRVP